MQNETPPGDIRNAWQGQGAVTPPVPLHELRGKSGRFQSQVLWRNRREYAVSAVLMVYFGYRAWFAPSPIFGVGYALMIAGLLDMVYQLHLRAAAEPPPADLGWKSCAEFHRAELVRQRDALNGVWKWYLGPLVPGLVTILAASCLAALRRSVLTVVMAALAAGLIAMAFWAIVKINQKTAAALQKQIDALDGATAASS